MLDGTFGGERGRVRIDDDRWSGNLGNRCRCRRSLHDRGFGRAVGDGGLHSSFDRRHLTGLHLGRRLGLGLGLRIAQIVEGANDVQRMVLARALLA